MQLIPATAAHVRAEISDHSALGAMLNAAVPDNWPPEMLADALPWFLQLLEGDPSTSFTDTLCVRDTRHGGCGGAIERTPRSNTFQITTMFADALPLAFGRVEERSSLWLLVRSKSAQATKEEPEFLAAADE